MYFQNLANLLYMVESVSKTCLVWNRGLERFYTQLLHRQYDLVWMYILILWANLDLCTLPFHLNMTIIVYIFANGHEPVSVTNKHCGAL